MVPKVEEILSKRTMDLGQEVFQLKYRAKHRHGHREFKQL